MQNNKENIKESTLKNNKEALILREIFNIIEDIKPNKNIEIDENKKYLIEKYKINKTSNFLNIVLDINRPPKNRYKLILKNTFKKK